VIVTLRVFGHAMGDLNDRGSRAVRWPSICSDLELVRAREPELFAIHRRCIIAISRTNSTATCSLPRSFDQGAHMVRVQRRNEVQP